MESSNVFYEAVAKKEVRKLRIMLKDSLLVDPTFKEFKELEKTASSVEDLYDVHDGRPFEENSELWDDAYMDKIMVQVVGNFSHERVEHLMKVVRKLRPVTEKSSNTSAHKRSSDRAGKSDYQAQKERDQANGNYREAKIAAGAVIGGVVCCAVGAAVASSAAAGAVVGAVGGAAAGAIVAYCTIDERK